MRESHTAVIERNVTWRGTFATEPYEVAWAGEAIFFVRVLAKENLPAILAAHVEISPDGMHWCHEGEILYLPTEEYEGDLAFCRVTHFGGWLRLTGEAPAGASVTVIVYLVLKE
ncbi:MAG: hypothetical protein R3C14_07705 [Caldilineaceae bacterium]